MGGWTAVVFGLLMAGALALVVLKGGRPAAAPAMPAADAGADAAVDPAAPAAVADAGEVGEPTSVTAGVDAGGTLLLSGEAPPDLAGDAPKEVTWGCILVQYKG